MVDPLDLLRVCRRSRIKFRVLKATIARGPCLPGELAEAASTSADRVEAVLLGDGKRFRFDSALILIGAVVAVRTERGVAYDATEAARRAIAYVEDRIKKREERPRT